MALIFSYFLFDLSYFILKFLLHFFKHLFLVLWSLKVYHCKGSGIFFLALLSSSEYEPQIFFVSILVFFAWDTSPLCTHFCFSLVLFYFYQVIIKRKFWPGGTRSDAPSPRSFLLLFSELCPSALSWTSLPLTQDCTMP